MKGRIATALSLTGVLVAGSAAALVNTQVLHNSSSRSADAVLSPSDTDPSTDAVTSVTEPSSTGATTSVPASPVSTATTVAGAPVITQAIYQIGDAGTITLDTVGNQLSVVTTTVNPGWMVTRAVNDDPLNIEAVFESAGSTVEFHANLLFGVVSTSVRASSPETATTSGDNGGPVTTGAPHHDDGGSDDTHDGHHSHPGGPGPGGGSDD